eukprot:5317996-Amphidinium_carterae.2
MRDFPDQNINQAETYAILQALRGTKGAIRIVTDSQHCRDIFQQLTELDLADVANGHPWHRMRNTRPSMHNRRNSDHTRLGPPWRHQRGRTGWEMTQQPDAQTASSHHHTQQEHPWPHHHAKEDRTDSSQYCRRYSHQPTMGLQAPKVEETG